MGAVYVILFFSTIVIFIINCTWIGLNLANWITNGLQGWLGGMNFVENIYYSIYLRWILLIDIAWIFSILILAFKRRRYNTNPELLFLS